MEISTRSYRTKQEFVKRSNPKGNHYIIGLDAGYSSMKVYYEDGYFCFPSYAKKIDQTNRLNIVNKKDILYKDAATGDIYMLGYIAQNMLGSIDTNDSDGEMFSRKRYGNPVFKILCNAAIALALNDKEDDREIIIQTGLPSSYVNGDTPALIRTLSKKADFSLKIGNHEWRDFSFLINSENIHIQPQPAGSLYSVLIMPNGTYANDAKRLMYANTLVIDIGFGTYDFYGIKNRSISCAESSDEFGMREILERTSKKILNTYNEDIRVPALQKTLEKGTIICIDEEELRSDEKPISDLVEDASTEVFTAALNKAKNVTNSFRDYDYLIITGGTGEAWLTKLQAAFSEMKSLQLIKSNRNDSKLPLIYSNVRGYYLYAYANDMRPIKHERKGEEHGKSY